MFFFCFFSKNSRERRKITMPSRRWIDCDWGKVRNTWGQCRRMYIVLIAQTCYRNVVLRRCVWRLLASMCRWGESWVFKGSEAFPRRTLAGFLENLLFTIRVHPHFTLEINPYVLFPSEKLEQPKFSSPTPSSHKLQNPINTLSTAHVATIVEQREGEKNIKQSASDANSRRRVHRTRRLFHFIFQITFS